MNAKGSLMRHKPQPKAAQHTFLVPFLHIKRSETLVPPACLQDFDSHIHQLMSPDTTSDQFDQVVDEICTQFPHIKGWMKWWLRPVNASMIFPTKRTMSPKLAEKVPNTSNAVEHRHLNLHMAIGTDHDLFSGIQNLYLHMQEMEAHYNAIKGILFCYLYCSASLNILLCTEALQDT